MYLFRIEPLPFCIVKFYIKWYYGFLVNKINERVTNITFILVFLRQNFWGKGTLKSIGR